MNEENYSKRWQESDGDAPGYSPKKGAFVKLTKDEKLQLNAYIDSYMDTLNKINMVMANDAVSFEAKKFLLNSLDRGIGEVWENYVFYKTGK